MIAVLTGLTGLEALIVLRRRTLWMSLVPAYLVVVLLAATSPGLNRSEGVARVADWAVLINMLLGLVLSASFVGALGIKEHDGMAEIRRSTPTPAARQLLARVIGALTMTGPVLGILLVLAVYLGLTYGTWSAVAAAVVAYLIITIPAVLLILGMDAVLELAMPAAFARIVAVIVWGWAALFDTPTIPGPSLAGTVLSPIGAAAAHAFFGSDAFTRSATALFAWTNTAVVLALALALILATGLLTRARSA